MTWFRNLIWNPLVVEPLRRLYFHGPSNIAFGLGFWEGASNATICATVKNTSEDVWLVADEHCAKITNDLFLAFLIAAETMLYFYLLFQIVLLLPTVTTAFVWRMFGYHNKEITNKKNTDIIKKQCQVFHFTATD